MRFESREELAGKIMWEGGIAQSLEYGIKASDMPEGDSELEQAWLVMQHAWDLFESRSQEVMELLPELDYNL